jgi:hypothetical protein
MRLRSSVSSIATIPPSGECEVQTEELCSCHVNQHFHAANHDRVIAQQAARIRELEERDSIRERIAMRRILTDLCALNVHDSAYWTVLEKVESLQIRASALREAKPV